MPVPHCPVCPCTDDGISHDPALVVSADISVHRTPCVDAPWCKVDRVSTCYGHHTQGLLAASQLRPREQDLHSKRRLDSGRGSVGDQPAPVCSTGLISMWRDLPSNSWWHSCAAGVMQELSHTLAKIGSTGRRTIWRPKGDKAPSESKAPRASNNSRALSMAEVDGLHHIGTLMIAIKSRRDIFLAI